ncbi:hypothetical protein [Helicobacter apodemus]|uniref:Uncharacterized protein n=1 Tax=Helicobacter apodemus TaxID=135569 RepID=A0A2U8FDC9_9HELI|nr:hypothetical protein [Helicobacter apodemus]AWI34163.1 hypothetical protein CDV25_04835 [Helicobacter apodemus]
MTKKELEKFLSVKEFKETSVSFEDKKINVVICKNNKDYFVYSYCILNPAETMIRQKYKTIEEMLQSWFFTNLFKKKK